MPRTKLTPGATPPIQAELRRLTDALMSEIARLSGQEYVDHYASRTKAR